MVMKTKVRGKAFVFGKNIDTDQIYPGRFVEYGCRRYKKICDVRR